MEQSNLHLIYHSSYIMEMIHKMYQDSIMPTVELIKLTAN